MLQSFCVSDLLYPCSNKMSKRTQPVKPPFSVNSPTLRLYNSLTRQKDEFIPQTGKQIKWYSCGPTVYDASHMGHARSYISFDILRRVLTNYFGYDITYVMNITDIDDKIIKRARQHYLFQQYIEQKHPLNEVLNDLLKVTDMLRVEINTSQDKEKSIMLSNILEKVLIIQKILTDTTNSDPPFEKMKESLLTIRDPISQYLDLKYGKDVTDNYIFSDLPRYWESEFHNDMDALNVLKPNVLTRVSEYVPEIIEFIEKIIKNGLAYESNGSVYFDVTEFDIKPNHFYAKLVPEAYGDTKALQEGEGDLCADTKEKKSPTDFALWKASKGGEPWWNSPWGKGRPGWHIECSVMASVILGSELDIHTGGVDLKFPHHDNELAQAEAYFDNDCWVRYFLHSGHLTIAGCKMSKSLKNFITIKEALKKYSARQLRFAFLLHKWNDTLDYSENTMEMAITYEKLLNEFFLNVKDLTKDLKIQKNMIHLKKWSDEELNLNNKFIETRQATHEALCDNIDTRKVLDSIRECISAFNVYVKSCSGSINLILVHDIATYVTRLMQIFGTIPTLDNIGFPLSSSTSDKNIEEIVMPYLTVLAEFRHIIRQEARSLKASNILQACDKLRDNILPELGVRLEDQDGRCATIKIVDCEVLLKEKEEKERAERKKTEEKMKKLTEPSEKEARKKIHPNEMFKHEKDKYSKFDEKGLPTHDAEGKELSKGLLKRLQKLQIQQEKKYTDYLQSSQQN